MSSKDYYVDLIMSNEIEEWMLVQGAVVRPSYLLPEVRFDGKTKSGERDYMVFYEGSRVHFYAGTNQARIFFSKENQGAALILLVKWPDAIVKHNLPNTIFA